MAGAVHATSAELVSPLVVIGIDGSEASKDAGLPLGSTSEHCARHAPCPITIVHHKAETSYS
jgi:nucleotide-binding universal stress UspA family protein